MRSNNEFLLKIAEKFKQKEFWLRAVCCVFSCLLYFFVGFMLSALVFGSSCPWHLVLCSIMPILWFCAPTRTRAWLLSLGYYLGAARDTMVCYNMFFGFEAPLLSFVFWIGSSLMLSIPWAIFWTDYRFHQEHKLEYYPTIKNMKLAMILNLTLALFFVTVPPFGVGGWASPILGFIWLPFMTGMGFLGIVIGMVLVSCIASELIFCELAGNKRKKAIWIAAIIVFLIIKIIYGSCPSKFDMNCMANDCLGFRGIFTTETRYFGESSNASENAAAFAQYLNKNVKIAKEDKFIVLPEISAGVLDKEKEAVINKHIKASGNKDVILCVGAIKPTGDGRFENGLYFFDGTETEMRQYTQRFPTPFSMWFPWNEPRSFKAHWFDSGLMNIKGTKAVMMICPEYLFAFPVLYSFASTPLNKPKIIIAVNDNKSWPVKVKIPQLMDQHLLSWARLFAVPVLMAENFPVLSIEDNKRGNK